MHICDAEGLNVLAILLIYYVYLGFVPNEKYAAAAAHFM